MANKGPSLPGMAPQPNMSVQLVPKSELRYVLRRAAGELMRAWAEVIEAETRVRSTRDVVAGSCEAFKKIPIIGLPFDRKDIAGEEELQDLDSFVHELTEIETRIKALIRRGANE